MKKRNLYRLPLALIAVMAFAGAASAVTWSGGDGNWTNETSWGGSEPVSGDLATVNNGVTVTVNQAGEIAGLLQILSSSTVNVDAGDLTLDAVGQGASLSINSGTLNVDGGAVTAGGIVNNFLQNGGVINVSAGSVTQEWSLRFGDSASTGTLDVSGTGSWSGGNIVGVGTSFINLTGSDASISLNELLMWDTTMQVNFTPGSTGIDTIDCAGRIWLGTDAGRSQTLNVDTDLYPGARTVVLFTYGNTLAGTFKTTNITRTGVGNLTLGSDPGGNPDNLAFNEYYLDYGDGSDDSITLYYNVHQSTPITVTTADGMAINGTSEYNSPPFNFTDNVYKNSNFSPSGATGGRQIHLLTLDTATLTSILETQLGALGAGEKYQIYSATYTAGVLTEPNVTGTGTYQTEFQSMGGITVHAVNSTSAFNVDQATWNNRATGTSWASGSVSSADWGSTITTGVDTTSYSADFDLTTPLQSWVAGGANYGLAFVQSWTGTYPNHGQEGWTAVANVKLTVLAEIVTFQGTVILIQ